MNRINNPKTNVQKLINAVLDSEREMQIFVNGSINGDSGFIVAHNGAGYLVSIDKHNKVISCTCGKHALNNICEHTIKVALKYDLQLAEINITNNERTKDEENLRSTRGEYTKLDML